LGNVQVESCARKAGVDHWLLRGRRVRNIQKFVHGKRAVENEVKWWTQVVYAFGDGVALRSYP